MDAALLQRINLVEVLCEQAAAAGVDVSAVPEDAAETWNEQEIRHHFQRLMSRPAPEPSQTQPAQQHSERTSASEPAELSGNAGLPSSGPEVAGRKARQRTFAAPDASTFDRWFPGLTRSGTKCQPGPPRAWLLCLPSAGNAEDMYTSEGTGARHAPSPLLAWCRASGAEMLAVQPPGRALRVKEAPCSSAQQLAEQVLEVVGHRLHQWPSIPWVVISHSMGCWVAFELLRRIRQAGLTMPSAWFLSAMPAPDIPENMRPWRQQAQLDGPGFQDECRCWDINELVFTPAMWPTYEPLLRADFTLFDSYRYSGFRPAGPYPAPLLQEPSHCCTPSLLPRSHESSSGGGTSLEGEWVKVHHFEGSSCSCAGSSSLCLHKQCAAPSKDDVEGPFGLPITCWWGECDRRVTPDMVRAWGRFTTGPFSASQAAGNHLWPLQKEHKAAWLSAIVENLRKLQAAGQL
ncbi:Alpha/Beta hydrolase protein [Haematococcus lacustris]